MHLGCKELHLLSQFAREAIARQRLPDVHAGKLITSSAAPAGTARCPGQCAIEAWRSSSRRLQRQWKQHQQTPQLHVVSSIQVLGCLRLVVLSSSRVHSRSSSGATAPRTSHQKCVTSALIKHLDFVMHDILLDYSDIVMDDMLLVISSILVLMTTFVSARVFLT